jgi:predicted phage tail protein
MIKVIVLGEHAEEFNLEARTLREILSLLKIQKGKEWTDRLLDGKYKYLLAKEDDLENMIGLAPEVVMSDFEGFDYLIIVPEVSGEEPFSISFAMLGTTAALATTAEVVAAYAITAVLTIAASYAINMVMSLLSPTPEFSTDPGTQQQTSSAFNGAPIIRNQGCSVPLVFGNPYCGGVLISSGLFSEEKTV